MNAAEDLLNSGEATHRSGHHQVGLRVEVTAEDVVAVTFQSLQALPLQGHTCDQLGGVKNAENSLTVRTDAVLQSCCPKSSESYRQRQKPAGWSLKTRRRRRSPGHTHTHKHTADQNESETGGAGDQNRGEPLTSLCPTMDFSNFPSYAPQILISLSAAAKRRQHGGVSRKKHSWTIKRIIQ